ncbi:MAG: TonB family protein [Bacteroidota bacterium]
MVRKYKVVNKAPFVAKKEIKQMKDFEKVLFKVQEGKVMQPKLSTKYRLLVGLCILLLSGVGVTIYQFKETSVKIKQAEQRLFIENKAKNEQETALNAQEDLSQKDAKYKNENILETPTETPLIDVDDKTKEEKILLVVPQIKTQKPIKQTQKNEVPTKIVQRDNNITKYNANATAYEEATPIIGLDSLYTYLSSAIIYPEKLKDQKIAGTVVIEFVIDESGKAKDITVLAGLHEILDQEAMRIIREMPPWSPAKVYGEPIPSTLSIPITFHIE